jgi:hypothetical protein
MKLRILVPRFAAVAVFAACTASALASDSSVRFSEAIRTPSSPDIDAYTEAAEYGPTCGTEWLGCDRGPTGAGPSCGVEASCGCETSCGCQSSCGCRKKCGGLLDGLLGKSCGCRTCSTACDTGCGCEADLGCGCARVHEAAPACGAEVSCGVEVSCGCEASCGCQSSCGCRKKCGGLLDGLFGKSCGCRTCSAPCDAGCGCEAATVSHCNAGCGCAAAHSAPTCGSHKSYGCGSCYANNYKCSSKCGHGLFCAKTPKCNPCCGKWGCGYDPVKIFKPKAKCCFTGTCGGAGCDTGGCATGGCGVGGCDGAPNCGW